MSRSVTIPDQDGAYDGVDEESYHSDPTSLSVSGAKLLLPPSCPAKFRHARDNPQPPRRAFDFGHLAHRMVLGAGSEFTVLDPAIHGLKKDGQVADNPRATSTWKNAESEARRAGRIPVSVEEWRTAEQMAEKVRAHPQARELFTDGQPELALYHRDPETGVRLRGRLDWLRNDGTIIDYKTCQSAEPREIERAFHKFSYHMQNAWYVDLVDALGLSSNSLLCFVAQEKVPPYEVTVVEYDQDAIAVGRERNREAIRLYAELMQRGEWPSYTSETITISLPAWAAKPGIDTAAADLINQLEGLTA
ncbi:MAG: PD-(D/E)XK nuclease-like domain-containing protein [Dehalococcoidia bacterium]|nr:PD-(D/E)XK nuclease-like domain-containing protein [Dehalococcoidia bacterium]